MGKDPFRFLSDEWQSARDKALTDFANMTEREEIRDRALLWLAPALRHADLLGLSRRVIADAAQVSLPTIGRWIDGGLPHISVARAALEAIADTARAAKERP